LAGNTRLFEKYGRQILDSSLQYNDSAYDKKDYTAFVFRIRDFFCDAGEIFQRVVFLAGA